MDFPSFPSFKLVSRPLPGLVLALGLMLPALAQERITVNCAQPADPPLVRKFGVASSCTVPMERYRRDAGALAALKPAALRLELGWGFTKVGWTKPLVSGSAGNVQYAWEELDELARLCADHAVDLAFAYCYTPPVFQRDDWYSPPTSLRQWAGAAREYAFHFRLAGQPIAAHEVWNRTDSSIYFGATRGTYLRLYKEAALALREADADALIGGPVIASQGEWVVPFLGYVEFEKLPLDFFSLLAVSPGEEDQIWGPVQKRLTEVRKALTESKNLRTTEVRLNAFNPLSRAQLRPGAAVAQPALAAELLGYLEQFLLQPDLTAVNWSQFQDSGITNDAQGLLDLAGNPRPAFGALAIYADMPVDRVAAAAPAPLRVLASRSPAQASAVIWNPSPESRTAVVEFQKLPFSAGTLGVHRIDAQNSVKFLRTGGWEIQPGDTQALAGESAEWRGEIPPQGVVYLRAESATPVAVTNSLPAVRVARLHRWFRDRYAAAYADFDRATFTARLGMSTDSRATAIIGANLVNCPTNLQAVVETSGNPRKLETGSTLGVRVDIFDRGGYTTSVLFHAGLYDAARTEVPPWGTRRAPDKVVPLPPGTIWDLSLGTAVPPGWGGRAIVTFILRDAGVGARAKFRLTAPGK
jgi:hypothetical protein